MDRVLEPVRTFLRKVWRRLTVPGPDDVLFERLPGPDGLPVMQHRPDDTEAKMPRRACSSDEFERSADGGRSDRHLL